MKHNLQTNLHQRKDLSLSWGIGVFVFVVVIGCLIALLTNGCTKTNTITGPGTTVYDTVKITVVDTVEVDTKSTPDFYNALQQWIYPQLAPYGSYFAALGTEDAVAQTISQMVIRFEIYWLVADFTGGTVWVYAGIFKVT